MRKSIAFGNVADTVIRLTGSDALEWLQGQVTQDVSQLSAGTALQTCLLDSTGRILDLAAVVLHDRAPHVLTSRPERWFERVDELVVMEDVTATETELHVCTVQGNPEPVEPHHAHDRSGFGGYDVLGKAVAGTQGFDEGLAMAQVLNGVPVIGVDTDSKTLPPELGEKFMATHVSHSKGCYVGQEIVHRIFARGHTNRSWVGVRSERRIFPGEPVVASGETVGKVNRAVLGPEGWVGTATIRNEALDRKLESNGVPVSVRAWFR